ncbi:MAG: MBOAT family protein, partial [Magnetococcales bacterium]|nr:MBOAT family protein [Magnetococcales bacterium]
MVISGLYFYGYVHPWFLLLLLASTITDFYCSLGIERFRERRGQFLLISVLVNLGLLSIFKYFNFFMENLQVVLSAMGFTVAPITLQVILPVGISFYTFQTMSYTIDVYRGSLSARHSFLDFIAFTSFFPPLVAGPITRGKELLPQIEAQPNFSWQLFQGGFFLIVWGFFKKLVISDNVAMIANKVFLLEDPSFFILWAGAFAFSIQIFTDFSGYTDIARGTALLLGYRLPINFNHPYLAASPTDFWKRWHISLSQWIKDYVYIPLGGSRQGVFSSSWTLMVAFLLCGLWHGANWNYIIWGGYHGLLILFYRYLGLLIPADGLPK